MKSTAPSLLGFIAALTGSVCLLSDAQGQSEGEEILDGFGVSAGEIQQLEAGDVLAFSDSEYEQTNRELAADAMVLVDADIDSVLAALEESTTLIPTNVLVDAALIESAADFAGMAYVREDIEEVESLFAANPRERFNLSAADAELVEATLAPHRNGNADEKTAAASSAMRAILSRRYEAYLAQGLGGVVGYDRRGSSHVDVGAELRLTTEAFRPFEDDFPEFIRVMSDYPEGAACCTHHFRWLKVRVRSRPTFALTHTIIQVLGQDVLVMERHYYISTQLNSLQITTAWVPYETSGYLGLAVSASADVLDTFMGRMLRPLGRNLAKRMVTDVMVDMKAGLEERVQGAGSSTGAR